MIRGIKKEIIVVNPDKHDIFEKAIFFVSPRASRKNAARQDLLREAKKIIAEKTEKDRQYKKKKFKLFR